MFWHCLNTEPLVENGVASGFLPPGAANGFFAYGVAVDIAEFFFFSSWARDRDTLLRADISRRQRSIQFSYGQGPRAVKVVASHDAISACQMRRLSLSVRWLGGRLVSGVTCVGGSSASHASRKFCKTGGTNRGNVKPTALCEWPTAFQTRLEKTKISTLRGHIPTLARRQGDAVDESSVGPQASGRDLPREDIRQRSHQNYRWRRRSKNTRGGRTGPRSLRPNPAPVG
ncbi:hypothetical protein FB451DRAFT_1188042 [Mycena latifolia]|nr:hypothetical protein FB451DRAFT_1188042 [Mycena latifolia]